MRGWLSSLDEVPDEVFAQRVLGDGICIDPTSDVLHAPCDGVVVSVPDSKHAVALRTAEGAELLLHVGIDTVALGGEGFEAHVRAGDRVTTGQRLLSFDLQRIALEAKSLITPIVVTNGESFELVDVDVAREVDNGDVLGVLMRRSPTAVHAPAVRDGEISRRVRIALEHGIHARPAAMIAQAAKALAADIQLRANGRSANAKSAVAMLSLGVKCDEEVVITASGDAAEAAVATLAALLCGRDESCQTRAPRSVEPASTARGRPADGRIRAVVASRGLAIGRAVVFREIEIAVDESGRGVAHESAELERARSEVRERLQRMSTEAHATAKDVIAAHLEFLDDWELVASARRSISRGKSAAFAWRRAVRDSADTLRALGDSRLTERIDDLLDLESQVLQVLVGTAPVAAPMLVERAIVVCDDLKPSQFVALDTARLAGICMASGGPTSHVAILAGALGVPMLVAAGAAILSIAAGESLILDAEAGVLHVAPDAAALEAAEHTLVARQQRKQAEQACAQVECRTADGERIEVFANLGSATEASLATANGAEGCGLLRTEFLFLERSSAPDENEQRREYQSIADALNGRALVVRTLDIGGDKPIPYLPLPAEANPALGLRGIRTSLWRPDLLRTQLRAILAVQPYDRCRVLLPMITDVGELRAIRRIVTEICRELNRTSPPSLGVMIETPAAAMLADQFARECDFLSIGTNDLTQYALAMDRTHSELAHRNDGLHPAVLRLIERVSHGAQRYQRLVAVCGGLASDPLAVPLLIGLGVRELSVVPGSIPHIKSLVRTLTLESSASLAASALQLDSADAVRALVREAVTHPTKVTS